MFHPPEACHIFFSYSLQMVEIGSSSCTTPMFFQTPWLSYFQNWKSAGRREQSHNLRIWYRVGWKYSVCALQFVVVYRDNVKDVVSVHRVVWAINFVTLYRGLTVLNPNIISSLRLLLHRVNKKTLCTWWLQYRKLQVMFKVSPASLQTFIDTPNCVLEDRVQYSTVHIPNVFYEGHRQHINCVRIVRIHRVFTVRVRSQRLLYHPVFSPVVSW